MRGDASIPWHWRCAPQAPHPRREQHPSPDRTLGCGEHFGLCPPLSAVPGDVGVPRLCQGVSSSVGLVGAATLPSLGLGSPAFPTPVLGLPQMTRPPLHATRLLVFDQATAPHRPFTGFNNPQQHRGGFGRRVPTPSLQKCLPPFLGNAKAPPCTPGRVLSCGTARMSQCHPPPGCHMMRTLGPEVGESSWR